MPIEALIDKVDNSEAIRDQIAAILVAESASQQALATAGGEDPNLWLLKVYLERNNPWSEFMSLPETAENPASAPVIVNVALDRIQYEKRSSNPVARQKAVATYNIDVYGYGVSADDGGSGHVAGDEAASLAAQRGVRLVRNILMAAHYTYLGFSRGANQFVWGRWPQGLTMFQPSIDGHTVQHVVAARLAFDVEFDEFSPQVTGQALDYVSIAVTRAEDGSVILDADYDLS